MSSQNFRGIPPSLTTISLPPQYYWYLGPIMASLTERFQLRDGPPKYTTKRGLAKSSAHPKPNQPQSTPHLPPPTISSTLPYKNLLTNQDNNPNLIS